MSTLKTPILALIQQEFFLCIKYTLKQIVIEERDMAGGFPYIYTINVFH